MELGLRLVILSIVNFRRNGSNNEEAENIYNNTSIRNNIHVFYKVA